MKYKVQPTSDGEPIITKSHPRNTMLGMTLLIESHIPEAKPEQINRLAIDILKELNT